MWKEVFHGAKSISKTDFFSFFQTFSNKTFTANLCKSAFKKTGLIPYNPPVVLDKMKVYGGIQENQDPVPSTPSRESTPTFATPPSARWSKFKTPVTFTQRKRGVDYIDDRIQNGPWPLTPTAIHVKEKTEKGTQQLLLSGNLSTELLRANNAAGAERDKRKNSKGTIVQKFGEIYGGAARRQMRDDDEDEKRVVNMREQRLKAPWKKKYKAIMKNWEETYNSLILSGRFACNLPSYHY